MYIKLEKTKITSKLVEYAFEISSAASGSVVLDLETKTIEFVVENLVDSDVFEHTKSKLRGLMKTFEQNNSFPDSHFWACG